MSRGVKLDYKDTSSELGAEIISCMISAQDAGDIRADFDVLPGTYLRRYRRVVLVQRMRRITNAQSERRRKPFTLLSLNAMSGVEQVRAVLKHTHVVSFSRLKSCAAFRHGASTAEEAERALSKH